MTVSNNQSLNITKRNKPKEKFIIFSKSINHLLVDKKIIKNIC